MNKAVYVLAAGFVLLFLIGLVPEQASPKPGPRVVTLNESNTVSLNTPIMPDSANALQQDLMTKSRRLPPNAPIYLTLNSPGGSIGDGQRIIETAQGLPNPVHTISIFSASMSFIISQYLDRRLIVESGTMMSHRAYAEGVGGQVPGNLVTRALGLLSLVTQIDNDVAHRVGMKTEDYQAFIANEAWLKGRAAVTHGFADEVVRVYCDKTLNGPGQTQSMTVLGMFKIKVTYHKCPLITEPLGAEMDERMSDRDVEEVNALLFDKSRYIRQYGASKLYGGK